MVENGHWTGLKPSCAACSTSWRRCATPVGGCPWDLVQDFDSIAPYTIEEAYEVADAIARRDFAALPDELGDLLFQVVYHARMAEEAGRFGFADVARAIADKMVRRHPHVFGDAAAATPGAARRLGGAEARRARRRSETGTLAGVPAGLPALTRARKLTARAARVGFDWPDAADGARQARRGDRGAAGRAAGRRPGPACRTRWATCCSCWRTWRASSDLDPEACLRHANDKFSRRFEAVEQRLAAQGLAPVRRRPPGDGGRMGRGEGDQRPVSLSLNLGRSISANARPPRPARRSARRPVPVGRYGEPSNWAE